MIFSNVLLLESKLRPLVGDRIARCEYLQLAHLRKAENGAVHTRTLVLLHAYVSGKDFTTGGLPNNGTPLCMQQTRTKERERKAHKPGRLIKATNKTS